MAMQPEKKHLETERRGRIAARRIVTLLLLVAVLSLAAYFRFRGLAHSEMGSDQSILYSIAMTWVNGGPLPLAANKSSAGIMNPPLVEYLIGLPLMVRTTILSAVGFQALLSVAAVLALYLYTAPLFGRRVALLASFLFAANPWAVHYSRFIWNPNPIPLFSTLLLGSLLAFVAGRRPIHLALAFLWLAAVTQLHLSALVLVPVFGLVLLIFHRRWWPTAGGNDSWKRLWPLLLGATLFLLLYAPFIRYEAAVGFGDVQAVWNALRGGQSTLTGEVGEAAVNPASWLLALDLATGSGFSRGYSVWRQAVWPAFPLLTVARWLFVAALAYATVAPLIWFWQRRQNRRQSQEEKWPSPRLAALLILALWIVVPVLAYVRHTVYLQHYYFLYLLPAPYLLLVLFADQGGQWLKRRVARTGAWQRRIAAYLLVAPLVLLGIWHVHLNQVGLESLEAGDLRPERTVAEVQALINRSQHLLSERPECDLVIVAEAGTFEKSPLGLVRDFVHPRPVRFLEAGRGYIVPNGCSLYLRAAGDPLIDEWLATAGQQLAESEEGVFYRVAGGQVANSAPRERWVNGLALLSVETGNPPAAGQTVTLTYRWQVTETPTAADYHFFNHVLDGNGQLVAQEDAAAIDARNWQEGDVLVTRFRILLPAEMASGPYTVQVGQYTWPDLKRVSLEGGGSETAHQVLAFRLP